MLHLHIRRTSYFSCWKRPKVLWTYRSITVGNERFLVVSNQSGKSNVINKLKKFKIDIKGKEKQVDDFLDLIKNQESLGCAYDGAEAVLNCYREELFKVLEFYSLETFKVSDEKIKDNKLNLNLFLKQE